MRRLLALLVAVGCSRDPVAITRDVPYATASPSQRLDLHLPRHRPEGAPPLPVIVFLHGGSWTDGNKASGTARLRPFVKDGAYAGIAIGIRQTGEAPWPAQLDDLRAAFRWIRVEGARHGLDAERIGIVGRSSGAHLGLILALAGEPGIRAVVSYFGATDLAAFLEAPRHAARDAAIDRLLGGPLAARLDVAREASPVTYVSAGDPPVLTIHGTRDETVPFAQARRLDEVLREHRVPHTLLAVEGAGHGDVGDAHAAEVRAFFDLHLARPPSP